MVYYLSVEFEWDENKNEINKVKHGISFETAALVFQDEDRVEIFDRFHSSLKRRTVSSDWKSKGNSYRNFH